MKLLKEFEKVLLKHKLEIVMSATLTFLVGYFIIEGLLDKFIFYIFAKSSAIGNTIYFGTDVFFGAILAIYLIIIFRQFKSFKELAIISFWSSLILWALHVITFSVLTPLVFNYPIQYLIATGISLYFIPVFMIVSLPILGLYFKLANWRE